MYARDPENLARLASALEPLSPYLRGAPPGLPFRLDVATLERGLNFTLTTSAGDLDLLGEIAGGGSSDHLIAHSTRPDVACKASVGQGFCSVATVRITFDGTAIWLRAITASWPVVTADERQRVGRIDR